MIKLEGKFIFQKRSKHTGSFHEEGLLIYYKKKEIRSQKEFEKIPKGEVFKLQAEGDAGWIVIDIGRFKKI